jgi:hypothetical protein
LEIKFGFAVLAVRSVDEDAQVRGLDFGSRELQDDLLTVWGEKTEFPGFTVRGPPERIGNCFFFVLHGFDGYGIRRGVLSVANVQIDAKGQGFAGEVHDEHRLRCTVSLFEIRNQSRLPGEEIGMAASQSSSEKIGVADGTFRNWDIVGRDGNPEGEGKKHSEECGPSLRHCLARMKDVFCR